MSESSKARRGGPFFISRPSPAGSRVHRGLGEKAFEDTAGSLNNSRLYFKRSQNALTHGPTHFGVFELSENSVISVRGSEMNSVGGSITMNEQVVLVGAKKQRTRVTLCYRMITITAASELLGSTSLEYCKLPV